MDVRGFGETSARWKDYSARAVGRDALAVINHLNAGAAVILGNSFAAGSALWAAHDAPERVSGAVLLGPIVRDQKPSAFSRIALNIGIAGPWRVWFWTTYWDTLFPSAKPADHLQIKRALSRNLHEPGRMAALKTMINLSKADTAAIVPKSRVSTLIVMGTRDPDFPDPAAEAHRLAEQLGAESLIVDGAGHYPHTEMPDLVAPKLLSFIARSLAQHDTQYSRSRISIDSEGFCQSCPETQGSLPRPTVPKLSSPWSLHSVVSRAHKQLKVNVFLCGYAALTVKSTAK
jgi:pimeloyl-ACP methyl ester carboxylesterase